MQEVLNIDSIHNNGTPRLVIGIRDKKFILELDPDTNTVSIYNGKSNELVNLEVGSVEAVNASGVMIYAGNYTDMNALTAAVDSGTIVPKKGYVVYLEKRGGIDIDNTSIKNPTHVVYTGEGWRIL